MTVLDRAIAIRRDHGTQVTSHLPRDAKSKAADDRHSHFIEILEHVRDVLHSQMGSDQVKGPLSKPVGEEPPTILKNVTNKFDHLEVQEPSEGIHHAPNLTPTSSTKAKQEVTFEAEHLQDFEEAYLGFNLLLHDYHNLRTVILRTWEGYQSGVVDLVCASLMTNAAIDIARRMQGDVEQLYDKYGGSGEMLGASYAATLANFFSTQDQPTT
ncbi:uncharacterized protein CIMG_11532 [Coccidioides immitis RS]|uniref:DUF6604 domain-containing protein n=2 Tax=Coccidioides TaxID=5500 RepID=A0A0E1RYT9_COCIM|nr:uncharacterized protein CIMG_11532 [Coccidioides immitis RS]EAS34387.2 hypothetical protein CIMG_11532 [Coccidioides immitis RS]